MLRFFAFPLFLCLATPVLAAEDTKPTPVDPGAKSAVMAVKPDDIIVGRRDAPVSIIEYSSLSCPHCAHFHNEILPKLEQSYIDSGKAKLVVRPFPLNKPALDGAKLVACLPPERAVKFSQVLFKMQDEWAYTVDDIGALQKIAAVGGVAGDAFTACMANAENEKKILKSRDDAQKILGVESTPTFFIGDRKIDGAQDVKVFGEAIDAASQQ